WLGLVNAEGGLTESEANAFSVNRAFFESLFITAMTKSFKMFTLLAMIAQEKLPGAISVDDLSRQVQRQAQRHQLVHQEFGTALEDRVQMRTLLERNPIDAWTGARGTQGVRYFQFENGIFETKNIADCDAEAFRGLTQEVCDYRLAQYLARLHGEKRFAETIVCKLSHSSGKPILFLPDRDHNPGIPEGWTRITIDNEYYEANFVKIAINVMRKSGSEDNCLPEVLRSFFGQEAGIPGTSRQVKFTMVDGAYELSPLAVQQPGAQLWHEYMRAEIPPRFGLQFNTGSWNQGYVVDGDHMFLLVTLDKSGKVEEHQYADKFLDREVFQWVRQNRTKRDSPTGRRIANHESNGMLVHLFVRNQGKKPDGTAAPFVYCGEATFIDWEEDQPITVRWRLVERLSKRGLERFGNA
ncbi:MAG: DUF3427 domain-containing protein, partial [bacterium]